jgi:DNA replication and repair protein RecF
MYLTHLSLTNFRNYIRLKLDLPSGPVLLRSDNAQGKTNLLEAIYFLATTRSTFARAERQLVNWQAMEQDPRSRLTSPSCLVRKERFAKRCD